MAKKRKGLPFVVQPRLKPIIERIGTEETGILEIERRGHLTVAEKAFSQAAQTDDESVFQMQSLAGRIAKKLDKSTLEIVTMLSNDQQNETLDPWRQEILEVSLAVMKLQEKLVFVHATALLFSRVDASWTVEQTLDLPEALVRELAELYLDEEAKDITALQEAFESSQEVERKGKS